MLREINSGLCFLFLRTAASLFDMCTLFVARVALRVVCCVLCVVCCAAARARSLVAEPSLSLRLRRGGSAPPPARRLLLPRRQQLSVSYTCTAAAAEPQGATRGSDERLQKRRGAALVKCGHVYVVSSRASVSDLTF